VQEEQTLSEVLHQNPQGTSPKPVGQSLLHNIAQRAGVLWHQEINSLLGRHDVQQLHESGMIANPFQGKDLPDNLASLRRFIVSAYETGRTRGSCLCHSAGQLAWSPELTPRPQKMPCAMYCTLYCTVLQCLLPTSTVLHSAAQQYRTHPHMTGVLYFRYPLRESY
jgi:hypothetical protein